MARKRVVITGVGVIASNALGKDAFFQATAGGVSGIKPISLFDTSQFKAKTAGEVKDFSAADFLGEKGLRTLDRATKLVLSASKLALDDARLAISEENTADIGVAIGTTLGSLASICDFDKEAITEGARFVNPALFSNTVINSAASQVSIKFNIQGFNTTIATGFTASLDAIKYAADFIRLSRAKMVLAGGVEELCIQTFLAFYKAGCLTGGLVLGEGAGVLVLEDLESALSRGAHIYAEISGWGAGFDNCAINSYNIKADGLKRAIQLALAEAELSAEDIDCIYSGTNSTREADLMETGAIRDIFGPRSKDIPVNAIKSLIGECFSASGSFQAAASAGTIEKDGRFNHILINAFGPGGSNSALIVSKFNRQA